MNKSYEFIRAELWRDVFVAYVSASNSTAISGAKNWADTAVSEFDSRFKRRLTDEQQEPAQ